MANNELYALIQTYTKLESEIDDLRDIQRGIQKKAKALCPADIGQEVEVQNTGNHTGTKLRVDEINFVVDYTSWHVGIPQPVTGFLLTGKAVKKDGSIGTRRRHSFIHWDEETGMRKIDENIIITD